MTDGHDICRMVLPARLALIKLNDDTELFDANRCYPHFQILAWKDIWIVGVFAGAGLVQVTADEPNDLTQQCVTDVYRNLQTATVRIRSGVDIASGVIVSETGLILTVAHGLKPGTDFATVVFPVANPAKRKWSSSISSSMWHCSRCSIDSLRDFAWRIVPVPEAVDCVIGELVIAGGLPARETDGMTTVVRLGEISGCRSVGGQILLSL